MKLSRALLAIFFVFAGVMHFVSPDGYLAIMPPWIPWPRAMIALSGAAEIAGGLGILLPPTRRFAAIGLILLLLAVFPANIHGAMQGMSVSGRSVPAWLLWARLPLQGVLIWWVYTAGWKRAGIRDDAGMSTTPKSVDQDLPGDQTAHDHEWRVDVSDAGGAGCRAAGCRNINIRTSRSRMW